MERLVVLYVLLYDFLLILIPQFSLGFYWPCLIRNLAKGRECTAPGVSTKHQDVDKVGTMRKD